MKSWFLGVSILASAAAQAGEPEKIASSGSAHVQLVELYSSESCSSCPPADKWAAQLKSRPGLWSKFIPVVFHVDYWNHLGWKDELSSSAMTKRQRDVAGEWPEPAIYTPAVVVDGQEWRAWSGGEWPRSAVASMPLKLEILRDGAANTFRVRVQGAERGKSYTVRLARLGMGLVSKVGSGENSGQTLRHDFVVLDWESAKLSGQDVRIRLSPSSKKAERYAVVAWLEADGKSVPLQAAGGYL